MRRSRGQRTTPPLVCPAGPLRRAVALMSTLVLMAVLAVSMAVSAKYLYFAKRILRHEWEQKRAFYLAESGLEHVIAGLLQDRPAADGQVSEELAGGRYWVAVTPQPGHADRYQVVSNGQVGDEQTGPVVRLRAVVRVESLFNGASRRVEVLSWRTRQLAPATQAQQTQPTATQPASAAPF